MFVPLWRFLVGNCGIPEMDADEIAQDVLMKVLVNVRNFKRDGRAKLTTWIFQIAHNLAVDFHRRSEEERNKQRENVPPTVHRGSLANRNLGYLMQLKDVLERLPPEDAQLLLWREQDFNYATIAGWLGIKEGAARTRHLRAMNRLKADPSWATTAVSTSDENVQEPGGGHE